MSKNFHGTIIIGPGQYDYHGVTIIAQPYPDTQKHLTNKC